MLASTVAVAPLSSFLSRTELPACVLPLIVTLSLLVDEPSSGEMIVSFGFEVSRTQVAMADSSLSPPGPTIDAWNALRPFSSATLGISWTEVCPIGCSTSRVGSASPTVTYRRSVYVGVADDVLRDVDGHVDGVVVGVRLGRA